MPTTPPFPIALGQRTLAAIVFTDVVGYSARMQKEETGTLELLEQDFTTMKEFADELSGAVLKTTGDGLLIYFSSAVHAVTWAVKTQRHFAERSRTQLLTKVLRHRVGIHVGDVFRTEDDVVGDGVNIAARVQTEAPTGGVCISQTAYDMVKNKMELHVARLSARQLKNISEPVPMYHVLLDGPELVLSDPRAVTARLVDASQAEAAARRRFWALIAFLVGIGGVGSAMYRIYFNHEQQIAESQAAQTALGHALIEQQVRARANAPDAKKQGTVETLAEGEFDFIKMTTRRRASATGADAAALVQANECVAVLDEWRQQQLALHPRPNPLLVRDLDGAVQETTIYTDAEGKIWVVQGGASRKYEWAALAPEKQGAIIVSLLVHAQAPVARPVRRGAEAFAYLNGLPEMAAMLVKLRSSGR